MTASKQTWNIPTFDLQRHHSKLKVPIDLDLKELAIRYSIFPLKVIRKGGKKVLLLAMRNPKNQQAIFDVEFKAGLPVVAVQTDDIDIQWLIQKYYYGRPLSPTPLKRPHEVTHDLFEQLASTADGPQHPNWVDDPLLIYEDPNN